MLELRIMDQNNLLSAANTPGGAGETKQAF